MIIRIAAELGAETIVYQVPENSPAEVLLCAALTKLGVEWVKFDPPPRRTRAEVVYRAFLAAV